jgi:signal transduction histidine kinase
MSSPLQQPIAEVLPFALKPLDCEIERRILIVDDEDFIRNMFADFLSTKYKCTTASSSDEALLHLSVDTYALVISDVNMPGRNGVELLREVVTRYPDTMAIMVSGVDRPQRIRDALNLGAFDYLIKPIELEVLGFSVERALQKRSLTLMARQYKADLERQNTELAKRKAELERLQAQLVHSEKMASLGQLAAGIAHELNNPAGFIYGNMDVLSHYAAGLVQLLEAYDAIQLPADSEARIQRIKDEIHYSLLMEEIGSIIGDCKEGAVRIRDVVQNLRVFSRLDEAEVKQIDIHEGIDSTVRLLSRYYLSGHIHLHRDYGTLPAVSCFAGQLNQVWMNLLVNAAQSISSNGEVRIVTRNEGDFVVVQVSDTGCGIAPENLKKIFDPFFTTKAVGDGSGLGLSITYGIVERHGGTITAGSTVGKGSTFTVRIPVEAKLFDLSH